MSKNELTEKTVISVGKSISLSKYMAYFETTTGIEMPGCEFQPWLNTQIGKTLQEAIPAYTQVAVRKTMGDRLLEERFSFISAIDQAFIRSFDEEMERLGYDYGGGIGDGYCWGKYMIIYSKKGAKTPKVVARIFIRESSIVLRLFFNQIDKHQAYIENAPEHIKAVFTGAHGACSCNPKKENCRMRKTYVVDGVLYEKCSGVVFEFHNPTLEKTADYIALLREFYPTKKQ